jgi:hypothetical protein
VERLPKYFWFRNAQRQHCAACNDVSVVVSTGFLWTMVQCVPTSTYLSYSVPSRQFSEGIHCSRLRRVTQLHRMATICGRVYTVAVSHCSGDRVRAWTT